MRRAALLASGAATVVLILTGCGGSGAGQATPRRTYTYTASTRTVRTARPAPPPSAAEILRAARLTGEKPGYQARLQVSIRVPQFGSEPATAVGSGSFDPSSNSGTLNLAVNPPGLLSLIGPLPTQVVIVGDALYVRVPADLSGMVGSLPKWLEGGVTDLGLADTVDPAVILSQTARDATETVPGQHARVAIDPATGLVRSLVLTFYDPTIHAHIRVALRFTGFSEVGPAQAPPADEVGSLAAAAQRLGF